MYLHNPPPPPPPGFQIFQSICATPNFKSWVRPWFRYQDRLPRHGICIIKTSRSKDCLFLITRIRSCILVIWHIYIETGPAYHALTMTSLQTPRGTVESDMTADGMATLRLLASQGHQYWQYWSLVSGIFWLTYFNKLKNSVMASH